MKIVTIAPIKKGVNKENLSYFTDQDVLIGNIVEVPLRSKKAYGLVVEVRDAEDLKAEIKSLSYSIKKISGLKSFSFISKNFVQSIKKIADYNATTVGNVLSVFTPKTILESCKELEFEEKEKPEGNFFETLLLQSDDEERYSTYKSLIREEFAKNKSVFFCMPTTEDILSARENLEKGIEKYTFIMHSGLPKKELIGVWKKILEEKHPILLIATGSFLSIPRSDLGTIVLEKESSRAYKTQSRPYLDLRVAMEEIAKSLKVRLVLGDQLLRVETLWEEKNGKYGELVPLKFRSLTNNNAEIINLKSQKNIKKKEFEIFHPKTIELLKRTKENNENTFIFCARKGLYPNTVCGDCGRVVVCKNCNAPVVLYNQKAKAKNLFVCNHCGERRDSSELCQYCGGWKLTTLGIGIEKVVEEIKNILPHTNIFILDKDHVKNHKQAVKIRDEFYTTPGSIMVGTELALTYLNQKIENTCVVTIDSYFSVPDFQINEKIFHILLSMKSLASKDFFIQTRQENTKIFEEAKDGNLIDFYRDEIEDRKATGYPPFATYIKLSLEDEKSKAQKKMEEMREFLKPYKLEIYEAWRPGNIKSFTINGLIGIQKKNWPDENLLSKLRSMPQEYSIRVDPSTLL